MKIQYRQGIISASDGFIQLGQDDIRFVDVNVSSVPVLATIAFKNYNYLISEQRTVRNAWGPFNSSVTQYLYWEIDRATGNVTRGSTTLAPLTLPTAPSSPVKDQTWFDTTEVATKVFNGSTWEYKLRVFAAQLNSGGIIVPMPFASQVGINTPAVAGYVLKDSFGNVFKNEQGYLLTSESKLTSLDTGSQSTFEGSEINSVANENIPKCSFVYLVNGRAGLASSDISEFEDKAPMGMVIYDAAQNEPISIVSMGKSVSNDQWDFALSDIGKTVYCGSTGEVTLTKPTTTKFVRGGVVTGHQTILLTLDWIAEVTSSTSGILNINVNSPLSKGGTSTVPSISLPMASNMVDGFISATDFARIGAVETALTNKANASHTHVPLDVTGLDVLLNGKANVSHSHVINDVTGLQEALNGKVDIGHTHVINDVQGLQLALSNLNNAVAQKISIVAGAGTSNLPIFNNLGSLVDSGVALTDLALINHAHVISDVTGLQTALDNKAPLDHVHTMNQIEMLPETLADKASLVHTHIISDVDGLQLVLDAKASLTHTHLISDVTGLQTILDNKASANHVHVINDVTGLQSALDDKANATHVHVIGDVTGLQLALDSKASNSHTHIIADVTGLQTALDDKANVAHTHDISDVNGLQTVLDGKAPVSHMHTLAGNLSDVDLVSTPPVNGNILKFNGTQWVPANETGGGGGMIGDKFLNGTNITLNNVSTVTTNNADLTSVNTWSFDEANGVSAVSWVSGGGDPMNDWIVIPGNDNADYNYTLWEVQVKYSMAPFTNIGTGGSWWEDDPGTPIFLQYGSNIDIDSGGQNESYTATTYYDKYIASGNQDKSIEWTDTFTVSVSGNLKFRPRVAMGKLGFVPGPTASRFAGRAEVVIKYIGAVPATPPF